MPVSNVHYSLIFTNKTGFKIWGNWAFLAPACYNMGWHSKKGFNKDIYKESKAWLWSTVNNGTYVYREKLCPKFGIKKPRLDGSEGYNIDELTVPMINEYIEKVVVHEATGGRKGKDRKQQVDVYFNFIGNCQVPQKSNMEKNGLKMV